jgi:transcriptional regulator with XRE-family HTH domain
MTEKERIEKVMQLEKMNSAVFATAINIQGSTLSHILNGRNNPSLAVLQNILNRFPNISPEWLIMGQGTIEKSTKQSQSPTLFGFEDENNSDSDTSNIKSDKKNDLSFATIQQKNDGNIEIPVQNTQESTKKDFISQIKTNPRMVSKIIIYYTDNTFQEFLQ